MAACHRNDIDQFGAQLVGELTEVAFRKLAEISRLVDAVKQWCFGSVGHEYSRLRNGRKTPCHPGCAALRKRLGPFPV
jgi:hypothetical protein